MICQWMHDSFIKIGLAKRMGLCYNTNGQNGYASLNRKQVKILREHVTVNADAGNNPRGTVIQTAAV